MIINKEEQHWVLTPSTDELLNANWLVSLNEAPAHTILDVSTLIEAELIAATKSIREWMEYHLEIGGKGVLVTPFETEVRDALSATEEALIVMPTLEEAVDAVFFAIIEHDLLNGSNFE
jgi:hypothetical protein